MAENRVTNRMQAVRWGDLSPNENPPGVKPGFFRWFKQYVGGPEPYAHGNREEGLVSDKGSVGFHCVPVGNGMPEHYHESIDEVYVVIQGKLLVLSGEDEAVLDRLDCVFIPAGAPHATRNVGDEDVQFIWFQWGLDDPRKKHYQK
jgi:mannose-6-phosphate isomerase-like protein (cupin superfamily)